MFDPWVVFVNPSGTIRAVAGQRRLWGPHVGRILPDSYLGAFDYSGRVETPTAFFAIVIVEVVAATNT